MTGNIRPAYDEFVFFSAGPVGDHALIIDWANRFFVSTKTKSKIIMKHPNPFLHDLGIPYFDHISYIGFTGLKGKINTFQVAFSSLWKKRCYVLVLPIPPPKYLKYFAYYIRFFTRSRMVALESMCGFSIPGGPVSSASFVGEKNYIPARVDTELYYEQANRMLGFLGYAPVHETPRLTYIDTPSVLETYHLTKHEYLVMHLCSSHPDRSLPVERWQDIIKEIQEKLPGAIIVCTGSPKDKSFISEALIESDREKTRIVCGVTSQELLTIYAHAKLNVTVHTGNAHLINMLHVPTVTVNFKGIHMFRFSYNEKGIELFSSDGCTCHPLERKCSMVSYHGSEYMACLFNISNQEVITSVTKRYTGQNI